MHERRRSWAVERDKGYISDILNPQVIGDLLGEGLRMRVYAVKGGIWSEDIKGEIYSPENNEQLVFFSPSDRLVVKIPRSESVFRPTSPERKLEKLHVASEQFEPYLVKPTLLIAKSQKYLLLQRRMDPFEEITPGNMIGVMDQVHEVFSRHQELVRNGFYMDLLGKDGITSCIRALYSQSITPRMTNLVIEHTPSGDKLRIPDISTVRLSSELYQKGVSQKGKRAIRMTGFQLDKFLIRHHFGFDFGTYE